jgi:hypothetical protein
MPVRGRQSTIDRNSAWGMGAVAMWAFRRSLPLLLALALALAGCGAAARPSSSPAADAADVRPTTAPAGGARLSPAPRGEAVVAAMLDAYNAGRLDDVLALLDDGVTWSDCDYRAGAAVGFAGKAEVADWLRQRLAERDRLEVGTIEGSSGNPPVGAVNYRRRTSDSLRALGFPDGIAPKIGTKVALTSGGDRIDVFANGPLGGSPEACRPPSASAIGSAGIGSLIPRDRQATSLETVTIRHTNELNDAFNSAGLVGQVRRPTVSTARSTSPAEKSVTSA